MATYAEKYEAVIGLEVHAELLTESKMFCAAPVVDSVTATPNSATLPLCLGMPGTLPVINRRAVDMALRVALALHCEIQPHNVFARKNYFYPDLPKGYQISQYEAPLALGGYLDIELADGTRKRIRVRRVHMEEDTGKLTHLNGDRSLVDYNRAGVPLLEIVSEPDIHSAEEAALYATGLRQILRYLGVNSGDLEKGVLRVEPNISLRPHGATELGTRTEVKNLNSFRALAQATEFELERQAQVLDDGEPVVQETRGWDENRRVTFSQRTKEDAHDYRYFPEPDLTPLYIDDAWIARVRTDMPELPDAKRARYRDQWGVKRDAAEILTADRPVAEWFEAAVAAGGAPDDVAKWMINTLFALLNERKLAIEVVKLTPAQLVQLIALVDGGRLNSNTGRDVLAAVLETGEAPEAYVARHGLAQVSDEAAIAAAVAEALAANPDELAQLLAGKEKLRGFFIGQVMRAMRGKGDPVVVRRVLTDAIDARR